MAVMPVAYKGGPLDGLSEKVDFPDLDAFTRLHDRYLVCQVSDDLVVFEWQPWRGHLPRRPCLGHRVHRGCPGWPGEPR